MASTPDTSNLRPGAPRASGGGVKNLLAMFEQTAAKSPSPVGSPVNREASPGPKPLGRVRTSFVAVAKDSQVGLQKLGDSSNPTTPAGLRSPIELVSPVREFKPTPTKDETASGTESPEAAGSTLKKPEGSPAETSPEGTPKRVELKKPEEATPVADAKKSEPRKVDMSKFGQFNKSDAPKDASPWKVELRKVQKPEDVKTPVEEKKEEEVALNPASPKTPEQEAAPKADSPKAESSKADSPKSKPASPAKEQKTPDVRAARKASPDKHRPGFKGVVPTSPAKKRNEKPAAAAPKNLSIPANSFARTRSPVGSPRMVRSASHNPPGGHSRKTSTASAQLKHSDSKPSTKSEPSRSVPSRGTTKPRSQPTQASLPFSNSRPEVAIPHKAVPKPEPRDVTKPLPIRGSVVAPTAAWLAKHNAESKSASSTNSAAPSSSTASTSHHQPRPLRRQNSSSAMADAHKASAIQKNRSPVRRPSTAAASHRRVSGGKPKAPPSSDVIARLTRPTRASAEKVHEKKEAPKHMPPPIRTGSAMGGYGYSHHTGRRDRSPRTPTMRTHHAASVSPVRHEKKESKEEKGLGLKVETQTQTEASALATEQERESGNTAADQEKREDEVKTPNTTASERTLVHDGTPERAPVQEKLVSEKLVQTEHEVAEGTVEGDVKEEEA